MKKAHFVTALHGLMNSFARTKPIKVSKSVVQLVETSTAKEPFFPEYIETLNGSALQSFYEQYKGTFSPLSVLYALKTAKRQAKEEPNTALASLVGTLKEKAISSIPIMTADQLNFYLQIISHYPTEEETKAIISIPFELQEDVSSLAFYLKVTSPENPQFLKAVAKLTRALLRGDRVEVQGHNLLLNIFELYVKKLKDYDTILKIEEAIKRQAEFFTVKNNLRVLEIYNQQTIKRPNFELLDVILFNISNHVEKFPPPQLNQIMSDVLRLGAESADFFSKAARYMLLMRKKDQATIDELAHFFYLLARLEFNNYFFYDSFFEHVTDNLTRLSAKGLFYTTFAHAKRVISRTDEYQKRKGLYYKRALKRIQKTSDDFYLSVFPLLREQLPYLDPCDWLGILSAAKNCGVKKLAVKRALVDISLYVLELPSGSGITSEVFSSIVKQIESLIRKALEAQ